MSIAGKLIIVIVMLIGVLALFFECDHSAWREACTSAGIPGFRFHDLRHTWASWHAQSGTPLQVLQELGGWRSFAMVQRYAHLSPGHLAQYASASLLVEKSEVPAQKPEQVDELAKRRA